MAEKILDEDFMRRIENLTLISKKIFRGKMKGERRSKQRGSSSEFADYRNYVEGDDLRFIDWNIYGRLDRLFMKLFLEEEDLHIHLLVDTSLSMGFGEPGKLDYAKKIAAAIAYIGLVGNDRVQVHSFSSGIGASTGALRGKRSSWQLFDFLEELVPQGGTGLEATCTTFARSRNFGKGIVILVSDLLDPAGYEEPLKRLIGGNFDVYVVHILAPDEVDPEITGDLRLVDVEDGSVQEVTVSRPLLNRYRQTLKNFCGGIEQYCSKRGATYVFSSTGQPFDQLVMNYLRRGGLLR